MLGYLINSTDLNFGNYSKEIVSVKALIERTNLSIDEILFGDDTSFGKYRVINKEGEKVNTYYTPKNCIFGSM